MSKTYLMVWCLTEGGKAHGKTIRAHEWKENPDNELMDLNGYVKNPLHLPDADKRAYEAIIKPHNELKLEGANKRKEALEKTLEHELEHLPEEETQDTKEQLEATEGLIDAIEADLAARESDPHLKWGEEQKIGQAFADAVEVENFLLNLPSERSKKKVARFLKERGIKCDESLTLKPLKEYAKEALGAYVE